MGFPLRNEHPFGENDFLKVSRKWTFLMGNGPHLKKLGNGKMDMPFQELPLTKGILVRTLHSPLMTFDEIDLCFGDIDFLLWKLTSFCGNGLPFREMGLLLGKWTLLGGNEARSSEQNLKLRFETLRGNVRIFLTFSELFQTCHTNVNFDSWKTTFFVILNSQKQI